MKSRSKSIRAGFASVLLPCSALFFGCGNSILIEGNGGAGGQGGAGSSHANGSVTVTHAATQSANGTSSSKVSTNDGTSVVSGISTVGVTNVSGISAVSVVTVGTTGISTTGVVSVASSSQVGSTGAGGAPPTWTCDPAFYAHNDGCDCGCGAFDPDCPSFSNMSCAFCDDPGSCSVGGGCPGNIDPFQNSICDAVVPENCSNHIDDDFDGKVDCADTDCLGHPGCPPIAWTCDPTLFFDAGCDCGCGAIDPACANSTVAACTTCNDAGSCNAEFCPGFIIPGDNAHCMPAVPEICGNGVDDDHDNLTDCQDSDCQGFPGCPPLSWTCPLFFYNANDGCDCGCGAFDPDCPDSTVASCVFCGDPGTCDTSGQCPGNINPTKNGVCL